MLNFIRKTSGTVNDFDDAVVLYCATHKTNGIIAGIGTGLSLTAGTVESGQASITIGSGQAICEGRQIEIIDGTAETLNLTAPTIAGINYYYNIYIKIDMRNPASEIASIVASEYSTTGYPDDPISDDLIQVKNGLAYFKLAQTIINYQTISTLTKTMANIDTSIIANAINAENALKDNNGNQIDTTYIRHIKIINAQTITSGTTLPGVTQSFAISGTTISEGDLIKVLLQVGVRTTSVDMIISNSQKDVAINEIFVQAVTPVQVEDYVYVLSVRRVDDTHIECEAWVGKHSVMTANSFSKSYISGDYVITIFKIIN